MQSRTVRSAMIGRLIIVAGLAFASGPDMSVAGTVNGVVNLSPRAKQENGGYLPRRPITRGFIDRQPTPLRPSRPVFDPFPYMVVVLDGIPTPSSALPLPLSWKLIGASLAQPLQAVQVNQEVEIHNVSRSSRRLHSPEQRDLLPAGPIDPGGRRPFSLKTPQRALQIRSHHAAHVFGWIVAFSHPYFSRLNRKGEFTIKNVPQGAWTLRIWYRDGWLDTTSIVEVAAARPNRKESITLPFQLTPKVPGQPDSRQPKPTEEEPEKPDSSDASPTIPENPE